MTSIEYLKKYYDIFSLCQYKVKPTELNKPSMCLHYSSTNQSLRIVVVHWLNSQTLAKQSEATSNFLKQEEFIKPPQYTV